MRTVISLLLCLLACMSASAGDKKKLPEGTPCVKVYMSNDSTCEGIISRYPLFTEDSALHVKRYNAGLFATGRKCKEQDIDSLVVWFAGYEDMKLKWVPLKGNYNYMGSIPDIPNHRMFMLCLYRGRNISAYVVYDRYYGNRVLYYGKGMTEAHAIFKFDAKLTDRRRKTLVEEFKRYPELVRYIDTMNAEDTKKNPIVLLRMIDQVWEE